MSGRDATHAVLCELRRFTVSEDQETPDHVLLARFVSQRDQRAFTLLVRRHGPLVLGLARRLVQDAHHAEDVFQAALLILARKAGSVRRRESVAGWLYRVTWRLASRCRRTQPLPTGGGLVEAASPRETPALEAARRDLAVVLDEEIHRLPERFRAPIVLCYLEELTQDEAAARLGWSKGTLRRRLEGGRELLRARLTRRGATLALGLCATAVALTGTAAVVSWDHVSTAAAAAVQFALGQGPAGATTTAVRLAEKGLRAMSAQKISTVLLGVCLGLLVAGGGLLHQVPRRPPGPPEPPASGAENPPAPVARQEIPAGAVVRLGRVGLAHRDNVSCAAFSPDGKVLATGGHDSHVRLWDPATGRELKALQHGGWVRSLVWAPGGKTLFSASDGEGVWVWDAASGQALCRPGDHKGMVTSLVLTADGKTLAYAVGQNRVVVRDVAANRDLFRFRAEEHAYRLAFSPDGQILILGGEQKKIRRWQVATGKELPALEGHRGGTYPVVFSPDGKLIASGGSYGDGEIHLWDAATGQEVRRWLAHPFGVGALAFSPDGKTLLSGHSSVPATLRLWDVTTGRELRSYPAPPHGLVDSVAFSPDGKLAASAGCWGRGVYLWEVETGKEASSFPRHHEGVTALAFTPDGTSLATGSADHTVGLWDAEAGRLAGRFRGHTGPVRAVAVAPDGKLVASAAKGESVVRLWSRATQEMVRELPGERSISCLAFSPDGRILAAGVGGNGLRIAGAREPDCAVVLWNVATGKELRRLEGQAGRVNALVFSPDGRLLATTGHDDKAVHLWDPQTGTERARLEHATVSGAAEWLFEGTSALAFSPDGRTLAAVSFYESKSNLTPKNPPRENEVRALGLWEIASEKMRQEIRLPRNSITSVVFLCCRHLVLGFKDGTIRPLDLATNQWLVAVNGHRDAVAALARSPDGRTFASGSWDATTLLWRSAAVTESPPLKKGSRPEQDVEALMKDLMGTDAKRSYRAVWELATVPGSVRRLEEVVRPVATLDPANLKDLIAKLDSDDFQAPEKATVELRTFRDAAEPLLRGILRNSRSAEARRRAEVLLDRLAPNEKEVGLARALEVLERLGTPEARRLLEAVAKGVPEARLTRDAKAALERLR